MGIFKLDLGERENKITEQMRLCSVEGQEGDRVLWDYY